ncbi:helix-turn-helix transcriptional regulator [Bradyrhizobium sp. STM 3557]|uniref:helix-turn-helix transcriptional regulator n=1 Tax=Bradyrhizobium sp. STM 3557 TaxID=578920 RepID=UPI00388E699B
MLAEETGVSLRTLYRDIQTLRAEGAPIDGEAGIGYVLRSGYLLPPLMFTEEEIEALVLGARWVTKRADAALGAAARNALARIEAVLPSDLADNINATSLLVGTGKETVADDATLAALRLAIRHEHKLDISYCNDDGVTTRRLIWPFAMGFFDEVQMIAAWCELRADYRHFRADRISSLSQTTARYPRRRSVLLREWRTREGIQEP